MNQKTDPTQTKEWGNNTKTARPEGDAVGTLEQPYAPNAAGQTFADPSLPAFSEVQLIQRTLGNQAIQYLANGQTAALPGHDNRNNEHAPAFLDNPAYNLNSSEGQKLSAPEITHKTPNGTQPQATMAVNTPNDEYEQEANAVAQQITDTPVQQKGKPESVQRVEKSDEEKEKEEAEDKKDKAKNAEEEKKEAGADQINSAKSATNAAQPQETQPLEPAPGIEPLTIDVAPVPEAAPEVPEATEDQIPEEGEIDAQIDESIEQAGMDTVALSWAALGPPNWNHEAIYAESFAALFSEEAQTQGGGAPGSKMLQLAADGGPNSPTLIQSNYHSSSTQDIPLVNAPISEEPAWTIDKPKHKNFFVNTFIGGTWNKGIDIANAVGAVTTESNIFGYMAAVLEISIKVLELLTTVLSYIALAMQIIALVLRLIALILNGVGAALIAVGNALLSNPFTAAAGPAFISAGTTLQSLSVTLQGWATTIGGWAKTIGSFCKAMTIIRLKMRAIVVLLRILDILYSLAMGASWEELQGKLGKILDQATGAATDGITLGLGTLAQKVSADQPIAGLAAKIGVNLGSKIIGGGIGTVGKYFKDDKGNFLGDESPIMSDPGGYWKDSGLSFIGSGWKQAGAFGEGATLNLAPDEDKTEATTQIIDIEGPPEHAPFIVETTAYNVGILAAEKGVLQGRLAWIEAAMMDKQEWDAGMSAAKTQSAADQAKMDEGVATGQQQMEASQQFQEKAKELGQKSQAAASDANKLGGAISANKGNIESGLEKGQSQGVDLNEADPAKTQGGSEQAGQEMNESGNQAKQGEAQAGKAENETGKKIEQVGEAKEQYQEFDAQTEETQSKNQEELAMLAEEREAILTRLDEIGTQEDDERSMHADASAEAENWMAEASAQREGEMYEALVVKGGQEAPATFEAEVLENEPETEEIDAA